MKYCHFHTLFQCVTKCSNQLPFSRQKFIFVNGFSVLFFLAMDQESPSHLTELINTISTFIFLLTIVSYPGSFYKITNLNEISSYFLQNFKIYFFFH